MLKSPKKVKVSRKKKKQEKCSLKDKHRHRGHRVLRNPLNWVWWCISVTPGKVLEVERQLESQSERGVGWGVGSSSKETKHSPPHKPTTGWGDAQEESASRAYRLEFRWPES